MHRNGWDNKKRFYEDYEPWGTIRSDELRCREYFTGGLPEIKGKYLIETDTTDNSANLMAQDLGGYMNPSIDKLIVYANSSCYARSDKRS